MFSVQRKRSTRSNPWSCLSSYGIKYYATKLRIILEVANFFRPFLSFFCNAPAKVEREGRFLPHLRLWKTTFFAPVFALAGQVGEGVAFCPQCGEGIFASRACYARIHYFSIFAFTSSPDYYKGLNCRLLGVKASPELPSPISGSGERKSTIGGEGRKG